MQDSPVVIRKWTELEGLAAITIDTGKKSGTLEDFYIDPQSNTIPALLIKTGLFGHRVLQTSALNGTGVDAITFASEDHLIKETDLPSLNNLFRGRALLNYRVLSESGTLVGEISNVLLNVATPTEIKLHGYQLAGGLRERFTGQYRAFDASEVLRYGQDVLILPDTMAQTLLKQ